MRLGSGFHVFQAMAGQAIGLIGADRRALPVVGDSRNQHAVLGPHAHRHRRRVRVLGHVRECLSNRRHNVLVNLAWHARDLTQPHHRIKAQRGAIAVGKL